MPDHVRYPLAITMGLIALIGFGLTVNWSAAGCLFFMLWADNLGHPNV